MNEKIIRDLLDAARPIAKAVVDEERALELEIERNKREKDIQKVLSNIKSARYYTRDFNASIIKTLIEIYLGLKEKSLRELKPLPESFDVTFTMSTDLPDLLRININRYLKGNADDRITNEFARSLTVTDDETFKICLDGKPLVTYRPKDDTKAPSLIPLKQALFDRSFFSKNGFDFQPDKDALKMQTIVDIRNLFNFVNGVLFGMIDVSNYLTREEIDKYTKELKSLQYKEKRIANFQTRCDKGLEIVCEEITKGLLRDFDKRKMDPRVKKYVTAIPIYVISRSWGKQFKADNYGINDFLLHTLDSQETNIRNWMYDNTDLSTDICYYPRQKGSKTTYSPIFYNDLVAILTKYGWTCTYQADEEGKKEKIINLMQISVNAQDLVNKILEDSKGDEEDETDDTKQLT